MSDMELNFSSNSTWEPIDKEFFKWLGNRKNVLKPGLNPDPTVKVLIFLALLEANKECTYEDIREILKTKKVIKGNVPENTLRTSMLYLGKTLEKANHQFQLQSNRGRFQLTKRIHTNLMEKDENLNKVVLILEPPAVKAEEIAISLVEKGMLPFHALYFLEWSARWWEAYSNSEAEIRMQYETNAWEKLGIKKRLLKNSHNVLSIVGLAPGEGVAEIALLKKILREESDKTIHYLAIDSSQRLLRDHVGMIKETFTSEITSGRLKCGGVIANIFTNLRNAVERVKEEFKYKNIITSQHQFLPESSSLLITYFGNCLGNNSQDQETELFTMLHSIFKNRPIEILVGVSVKRAESDEYKRDWDNFLLQTPRHLLETKKLLNSLKTNDEPSEFTLTSKIQKNNRCPPVIPELYLARHQISGQIYRFYYKLAFDLELLENSVALPQFLPKGSLILLYSIIKYDMQNLVDGIEKCGLFKISYDPHYHQIVNTLNGKREYALFSTYLE